MKNSKLMICLFIFCFCFCNLEAANTNEPLLYAWIDKVKVREKPTFKSKTISILRIGERVRFLGKKSKEKHKIELRKQIFDKPFYLITYSHKKTNVSGWVYGGALKDISSEIVRYDNIIKEVSKIENSFKNVKKNNNHATLSTFKYSGTKRRVIYEYYVGTNGCTGDEFNYYNDGGIIHTGEFFQQTYYFSPYSGDKSGVKMDMQKNDVLKKLGKPYKQVPNALMYMIDEESDSFLTFYFRDKKVFAIVHSVFESC